MRPPCPFARRMWITVSIGMLMVDAMSRDPEDRSPLERQRAAPREHVFGPLVGLVSTVSQQAMVAHTDAEHSGDAVQHQSRENRAGVDEEQCRDRTRVEGGHRNGGDGIQAGLVLPPVRHAVVSQLHSHVKPISKGRYQPAVRPDVIVLSLRTFLSGGVYRRAASYPKANRSREA